MHLSSDSNQPCASQPTNHPTTQQELSHQALEVYTRNQQKNTTHPPRAYNAHHVRIRSPFALPLSDAPEQAVRCLQLPRVREEKDKRRLQGAHWRVRCAQDARIDAEGVEGAADLEGGFALTLEDMMGVMKEISRKNTRDSLDAGELSDEH